MTRWYVKDRYMQKVGALLLETHGSILPAYLTTMHSSCTAMKGGWIEITTETVLFLEKHFIWIEDRGIFFPKFWGILRTVSDLKQSVLCLDALCCPRSMHRGTLFKTFKCISIQALLWHSAGKCQCIKVWKRMKGNRLMNGTSANLVRQLLYPQSLEHLNESRCIRFLSYVEAPFSWTK